MPQRAQLRHYSDEARVLGFDADFFADANFDVLVPKSLLRMRVSVICCKGWEFGIEKDRGMGNGKRRESGTNITLIMLRQLGSETETVAEGECGISVVGGRGRGGGERADGQDERRGRNGQMR